MTYYAFVDGIGITLIAVMVFLLIRLWAKSKLERWAYELTRETLNHLREAHLKLDSIQREQQHLLSRLDRATESQISKLSDLYSRLSQPKSPA